MGGEASRGNWLENYLTKVRELALRPGAFFATHPVANHYAESLGFLLITASIPMLIYAVHTLGAALFVTPLVWLFVCAGNWLWAVYLRWMARLLCKKTLTTAHAFQICSYANMPLLASWIPHVNTVTGIWTLALMWLGLTRGAGLDGVRALIILVIPFLLIAVGGAALFTWLTTHHVMVDSGLPSQWL